MHARLGGHFAAVRSRIIFLDEVDLPIHRDGYVMIPMLCESHIVATAVWLEARFRIAMEKVMVAEGDADYLQ